MTYLNKKFSSRKAEMDQAVLLKDLGEMVAPFIYDAGRNNIEAPDAIADAFDEIKDLLEDGFKKESYKGQLYYALHAALSTILDTVRKCDPETEVKSVQLNESTLAQLNTSYCQLSEAAVQYGGVSKILPSLRWLFSNNGHGHGPAEKKYKSGLLNEMVNTTIPTFFTVYKAGLMTDEALEFYAPPAPAQRLM